MSVGEIIHVDPHSHQCCLQHAWPKKVSTRLLVAIARPSCPATVYVFTHLSSFQLKRWPGHESPLHVPYCRVASSAVGGQAIIGM